jgi:hypothetical protein
LLRIAFSEGQLAFFVLDSRSLSFRVVGGLRFFERYTVVKELIAYPRLLPGSPKGDWLDADINAFDTGFHNGCSGLPTLLYAKFPAWTMLVNDSSPGVSGLFGHNCPRLAQRAS